MLWYCCSPCWINWKKKQKSVKFVGSPTENWARNLQIRSCNATIQLLYPISGCGVLFRFAQIRNMGRELCLSLWVHVHIQIQVIKCGDDTKQQRIYFTTAFFSFIFNLFFSPLPLFWFLFLFYLYICFLLVSFSCFFSIPSFIVIYSSPLSFQLPLLFLRPFYSHLLLFIIHILRIFHHIFLPLPSFFFYSSSPMPSLFLLPCFVPSYSDPHDCTFSVGKG